MFLSAELEFHCFQEILKTGKDYDKLALKRSDGIVKSAVFMQDFSGVKDCGETFRTVLYKKEILKPL